MSWDSVWSEVHKAVTGSRTIPEATEKVTALRGKPTTWDAIARAWRRKKAAGEERASAWEALGARVRPSSEEDDAEHEAWIALSRKARALAFEDEPTQVFGLPQKHGVIGDLQVKDGVPLWHLPLIARFFAEKEVDTVVQLGDWPDFPSLSRYDSPVKKAWEQRGVSRDIDATNYSLEIFEEEWDRLGWKPKRKVMTRGNHDNRLDLYIEDHPHLADELDPDKRLHFKKHGWEVYPFLQPVEIDGVTYAHFFPRSASGKITQTKRGAPSALAQVKREMRSCTAGHAQGLDVAIYYGGDRAYRGVILGSSYLHDEDYLSPQGNHHWRGVLLKHQVRNGWYDICEVSLDYLKRKYGD